MLILINPHSTKKLKGKKKFCHLHAPEESHFLSVCCIYHQAFSYVHKNFFFFIQTLFLSTTVDQTKVFYTSSK